MKGGDRLDKESAVMSVDTYKAHVSYDQTEVRAGMR